MEFIDLRRQYERYRTEIDARMQRVLQHAQYINGPEVAELEQQLAAFVGVPHSIGVASGTDALIIALMALGIGHGDEVITVPYTFFATAEAIRLVGATPIFVDIDPATYCIDVERIEHAVTPRTRAIMPVSLYGQMPDYDAINAIAKRHHLTVIEDAAQSFGATRHGKRSCGVTSVSCTSFFPAKPLGCYGDGGAIFTTDADLAQRMRTIRVHGSEVRHQHQRLGVNGRLDTLQAAVLLAKLPHFADEVASRAAIAARYDRLLRDCCAVPRVAAGNTHVYAQYTIRLRERERVAQALAAKGIPTAVHYPRCLHEQPALADLGHHRGDFPAAEAAAAEVLCLPMHALLSEAEQDAVVAALRAQLHAVAA